MADPVHPRPAPRPPDETQRLDELRRLDVFDTPFEETFDRLTRIAAAHFQVPIALLSLVDADRQWFKSIIGLPVRETSRDVAFCAHAILHRETMVVEDALADDRFRDNPLVQGDPYIRFYAGAPLLSPTGRGLGTVCVIDRKPRSLSDADRIFLAELAGVAMELLEHRRQAQEIRAARARERDALEQFRLFFENAPLPMYRLDAQGRVRNWNPAAERVLGWSEAEVVGKFLPIVPSDRRGEFEALKQQLLTTTTPVMGVRSIRQNKSGAAIVVSLSVTAFRDGAGVVQEFLGVVEDITQREEEASRLLAAEAESRRLHEDLLRVERELSRVDPLTGLGNRRACEEAFLREAARAGRGDTPLSVALFDIDHFKKLNDQAGHQAGDDMLCLFAASLKDSLRGADLPIRWGGEEFLALLPDADARGALEVANRVRLTFADRSRAAGRPMTVSGGTSEIVRGRQEDDALAAVVARADCALYGAKGAGRNRVHAAEESEQASRT